MMISLISFIIGFLSSIIVCSILINKNNKTNDYRDIDALNYRKISHCKKSNRKK